MSSPVVLLTPNLMGRDGISAVARLVASAFERVTTIALHEPRSATAYNAVRVHGAGGSAVRFAAAVGSTAIRGERPIVIVNHVHLAPAALAFAARGARIVSIVHGIEAWTPLTRVQRAVLSLSGRIIAVSAFSRGRFVAENPQFAARAVDVCHHGIGPATVADAALDAAPAALIVGRMTTDERYKGHDALIDIWPAVVSAVPGAQLRVVGDGDDRPRLQQRVASLGLDACIRFAGAVDDESLQRAYRRATGFVMPSAREGFGLVFLEAMRAARTCIGCSGSASEIIVDGETGWIVTPDDPAQLTAAVVRMLSDRPRSLAMGVRGRERYLQHFTEEQFRRRFTALVQGA